MKKILRFFQKKLHKNDNMRYNVLEERSEHMNIFAIADWFLQKESMNQKKLQKLCYYAQSWNLVFNGTVMFDGDFQAWVHGPVNVSLWNRLSSYGYLDIEKEKFSKERINFTNEVLSVLNDVWTTYGKYSGYQLELLTHRERPWIEARRGLTETQPSQKVISCKVMREYYTSLISKEGISE